MPYFLRKVAAPSASTRIATTTSSVPVQTSVAAVRELVSVLSAASAPQLLSLVDEDDVSPDDGGLMPCKRKDMDAGGERPVAVDLEDCGFVLRETSTVHVEESLEVDPEVLHLEEMSVSASMRPAEDMVEGEVHNDCFALSRQEEASSSGVAAYVLSAVNMCCSNGVEHNLLLITSEGR